MTPEQISATCLGCNQTVAQDGSGHDRTCPAFGERPPELFPRRTVPTSSVTGDQLLPGEAADAPPILIDGQPVDANTLFVPRPDPVPLTTEALMRLGAMMPAGRAPSHDVERHLAEQRTGYARYSREELVAELVRRDQTAIFQGQDIASGKLQGKLIREFLRGVLSTIDHEDLRRLEGDVTKAGAVERLLRALGAEPAPLRELKLHGSTLGSLDTRDAAEAIEDPLVRQMPSPQTAEDIRERQVRKAREVGE